MLIMEMRAKRMSVYKSMMRRRAFTKWVNLLLREADKQIVDIFDSEERDLLDRLLDIVLTKSEKKSKDTADETRDKQREIIVNKADTFKENYFKESQGKSQVVNRSVVIQFIWDLIEHLHITPWKHIWENEDTKMNAKDVLLKWLNSRLRGRTVTNFTTDWNDGTLLCELVNALEPGLIPPKVFLQGSWPQRNIKVALEIIEKAWGIPEIISPDDLTSSEVDELSVMTYVSLIFEYDLERLSANRNVRLTNGHAGRNSWNSDQDIYLPGRTGNPSSKSPANFQEKKPELGKIGKVIEYKLNLHDVNANEIMVSVEFKPAAKLKTEYKPDLRVYSLGKGRFRVKYTPNHAGIYRLSMYYKGEHIADSPYCLKVPPINGFSEKENDISDMNNNSGDNHGVLTRDPNGVTESDYMVTSGGFYGFDGEGLKRATVGKLAVFTVITDNRDKGPLSVCINCPAVSIPVPHVKTTHSVNYSTHTIAYMPTLVGTYNIYVRWGLKLINGGPFRVEVTDHDVTRHRTLARKGSKEYDKKRQSTEFSHIKVYYSSSALDPEVVRDTAELEELLGRYGITKGTSGDIWVSMDVELEKDERDMIFRLAGTRKLPLLFIHEKCLGGYEQVYKLDQMNELGKSLKYKVRKV